jgi:hypothetical protein
MFTGRLRSRRVVGSTNSPDEARIVNWLYSQGQEAFCFYVEAAEGMVLLDNVWLAGLDAKCECNDLVPFYIGNLNRLGLTPFTPPFWTRRCARA